MSMGWSRRKSNYSIKISPFLNDLKYLNNSSALEKCNSFYTKGYKLNILDSLNDVHAYMNKPSICYKSSRIYCPTTRIYLNKCHINVTSGDVVFLEYE